MLPRYAQRLLYWLAVLAAGLSLAQSVVAAERRTPFDHLTTGFELLGRHRDLPCEACHVNAVFKGTPTDCAACHGLGTIVRATAKTAGHIQSTNRCEVCHTPDAWSPAVNFDHAQTMGSCSSCHNGVQAQGKSPQHITTTLQCNACHTTAGWAGAAFSHAGITSGCSSCHNGKSATGMASGHIPIGSLDCNASGCHNTSDINAGGFRIGAANINTPTLTVAGHTTVASAVPGCQTCHQTAPYLGMLASTATSAGDSRPTALDKSHPTTGDCNACHTTTPTFAGDITGNAGKPPNHIPTTAPCAQCHTTLGDYSKYSIVGTHVGVTGCVACHGPTVNTTFANITIATLAANHIPVGSLDCNGSGCHTAANVNPGGFHLGSANINTPTLTVAGHTTVASAVAGCQTCHETAPYLGMIASTASAAGDSRPTALDKSHPTTGDCNGCHTTTPTFASDVTGTAGKPPNHIPTTAPCAQCHTTAGNYALYSVTGTHVGVTKCLTCHAPAVAATFANVKITTSPSNHIPIGALDCNGSGCHTTANVNPGGFHLGSANINTPTLTVAGHTTVASAVAGCQTCHETAPYLGMIASTASAAGDSRPTALDKSHPTTGDCNGCHTTTPTFGGDVTGKPTNHIPTSQPCTLCHTTPGNYAAYVMGAKGHTGITSRCATCHGPSVANTFANIRIKTTPSNHVPYGSAACESCHSASNFTAFGPGTQLNHTAVSALACDACHEYNMANMWYGVTNLTVRPGTPPSGHYYPQDCKGCHSPGQSFSDSVAPGPAAKSANRPAGAAPATQGTGAGTSPGGSAAATHAVGAGASAGGSTTAPQGAGIAAGMGGAATAPQGAGIAAGGTAANSTIASTGTASILTRGSRPAVLDHSRLLGSCVNCHNGVSAEGKSSRHVASNNACANCHTTNGWIPARFDHIAVTPHTCTSCHDGVHAAGKPRAHVQMAQQCDSCHGTLAWMPVVFDHSTATGACGGCHNNAGAVGKPASHLTTQRDCATCHVERNWSEVIFRHVSARYPGQHHATLPCAACHTGNAEQVPYPAAASAGTCGGCHSKDFKPAAHPKGPKGRFYSAGELANCSGACHVYSDPTQSTIVRSLPGPYHRVSDATFRR